MAASDSDFASAISRGILYTGYERVYVTHRVASVGVDSFGHPSYPATTEFRYVLRNRGDQPLEIVRLHSLAESDYEYAVHVEGAAAEQLVLLDNESVRKGMLLAAQRILDAIGEEWDDPRVGVIQLELISYDEDHSQDSLETIKQLADDVAEDLLVEADKKQSEVGDPERIADAVVNASKLIQDAASGHVPPMVCLTQPIHPEGGPGPWRAFVRHKGPDLPQRGNPQTWAQVIADRAAGAMATALELMGLESGTTGSLDPIRLPFILPDDAGSYHVRVILPKGLYSMDLDSLTDDDLRIAMVKKSGVVQYQIWRFPPPYQRMLSWLSEKNLPWFRNYPPIIRIPMGYDPDFSASRSTREGVHLTFSGEAQSRHQDRAIACLGKVQMEVAKDARHDIKEFLASGLEQEVRKHRLVIPVSRTGGAATAEAVVWMGGLAALVWLASVIAGLASLPTWTTNNVAVAITGTALAFSLWQTAKPVTRELVGRRFAKVSTGVLVGLLIAALVQLF